MTVAIFPPKFQTWLDTFLKEQGAVSGTVHIHLRGRLELAAAVKIPPQVRQALRKVLRGKGMAGMALERDEPVHGTPQAPNAEVALPVRDAEGNVRAVVGLTYADERELDSEQLASLMSASSSLPRF